MPIEGVLLDKARGLRTQLAEAERQAQLARAEYHSMIRRLHLSGASLRELAQSLEMSHQRVQQIVRGAGGTWWGRIWRTRNIKRDAVCTFCERPPSEVSRLIAGPDVFICDGCVTAAERTLAGGRGAATGGLATTSGRGRARCSFCHRRESADRALAVGPASNVCARCVELCRQILEDHRNPHETVAM